MKKTIMRKQEHKNLYWTGWCIVACLAAIALLGKVIHFDFEKLGFPCILNHFTGLYCPGCGGTRAVAALFRGEFLKSLYYHPIVLYTFIIFIWYMISQTVEQVSKGRLEIGMKYRDIYLYIGLVILILNFIFKNIMFLGFGIVLD